MIFHRKKTITHPFGEGVLRQGGWPKMASILPLNNHPISSSQPVSSMDATAHPGPWLLPSPLPQGDLAPSQGPPSASCPGSPLWQPKFRRAFSEQQRFLCRRKIHFSSLYLRLPQPQRPAGRGLREGCPPRVRGQQGLISSPSLLSVEETAGRRAAVPTQTSGCCPTAVVGPPLKDLEVFTFTLTLLLPCLPLPEGAAFI